LKEMKSPKGEEVGLQFFRFRHDGLQIPIVDVFSVVDVRDLDQRQSVPGLGPARQEDLDGGNLQIIKLVLEPDEFQEGEWR